MAWLRQTQALHDWRIGTPSPAFYWEEEAGMEGRREKEEAVKEKKGRTCMTA